jgi:hypothetical protein
MDTWKDWAAVFVNTTTTKLKGLAQDARIVLAGMIQSVKPLVVRNGKSAGQKMAAIVVEDAAGTAQGVMFADAYQKFGHLAEADKTVFVLGRIDLSRGDAQVIVERLVPIEGVPLMPGRARIAVPGARLNGSGVSAIEKLAEIVAAPGVAAPIAGAIPGLESAPLFPVELLVDVPAGRVLIEADRTRKVALSPTLVRSIVGVMGPMSVRVMNGVAIDTPQPKPAWASKKAGSSSPRNGD